MIELTKEAIKRWNSIPYDDIQVKLLSNVFCNSSVAGLVEGE